MIDLTRLNSQPLSLNADLIKYIEQSPDTVITLVTGDKLVVKESAAEVVRRVVAFRRLLMAELAPVGAVRSPATETNERSER